jgi:hypothetical protein
LGVLAVSSDGNWRSGLRPGKATTSALQPNQKKVEGLLMLGNHVTIVSEDWEECRGNLSKNRAGHNKNGRRSPVLQDFVPPERPARLAHGSA